MSFEEELLPPVFSRADSASLEGQRETLKSVSWALVLGLVAAVSGLFGWRISRFHVDLVAGIGLAAFLAAIALTTYSSGDKAQERWYRSRARAESVKTLAWRFAVGAVPFELSSSEADTGYRERMKQLLADPSLGSTSEEVGDPVTPAMAALRSRSSDERIGAYLRHRLEDQITWYRRRSATNDTKARRWYRLTIGANVVGALGALGRLIGVYNVDVLGIAAAAAGSATAWSQLCQHRNLATSYSIARRELEEVKQRLERPMTEAEWASSAAAAEEAISREHTLWLARHGY